MILHRYGKPFETFTADYLKQVTCFKFISDPEEKMKSSIIMQLMFLDSDYPNKDFPTKIEIDTFKWHPIDGEFKKKKSKKESTK